MIQIYKQNNIDFESNGDIILLPYICYIDTATWELNLNHPIDDDGRWSYIIEDAVLKVPSFNGDQLFRIICKTKMDSGVEAIAKPIFFDSKDDCMLMDIRPTNKNGQQALNILMEGTKYSGQSNITKISTAYYVTKNLMEALSSDDENSFLNRWGGEILYDNYTVIINEKLGTDRGVVLQYGKNIPVDGLSEEVSMEDVTTRIIPKAYNGYMLDTSSPWVDSPLINKYPKVRTRTIEYSDIKLKEDAQENDLENGVIVCDTLEALRDELIKKCIKEFKNGIDKPKVTITVDMVMLHKSVEYEDYKVLEEITKGDVIHCKHDKLGVITDARIVNLTYDCILDCIESVVIGDAAYNYINDTSSVIQSVSQVVDNAKGTIIAEKVAGIINGITAQLRIQRSISKKLEARALFMEDTDTNSPLFGATSWGTSGIEFTKRRTADGKDWDWSTALNANGLIADAIITGLLSDRTGNNYWNLDTGTFVTKFAKIVQATITDAVITGTLHGATIIGGEITGSRITGNEITNGNNFRVDTNGNMVAKNANFSGDITGSRITGSTINTTENINVGNNICLNLDSLAPYKVINAGQGAFIGFNYTEKYKNRSCDLTCENETGGLSNIRVWSSDKSNSVTIRTSANEKNSSINVGEEYIDISAQISIVASNDFLLIGNFSATGTKNRIVKTENYGNCLLNAVESTTAIFEDNGNGCINAEGYCTIFFNEIFLQTINTKCDYFVQLTKKNQGDLWCSEKTENYFIVEGLPSTKFDWNVKAKQRDYETSNLDIAKDYDAQTSINNEAKNQDEMLDRELKESLTSQTTFENEVVEYYESYMKEQEVTYE